MLPESRRREIKVLLESELVIVQENITELNKLLRPVSPDNAIGRLSRMDALEMQSVNQSKLDRQNHKRLQLKQALVRVDTDQEFGLCLECGQEIPAGRLELQPESRYCVSCQQGAQ